MGVQKIEVKVIPHASQEKVLPFASHGYKVYLRAKPIQGKANEALLRLLSDYFGISKASIKILRGEKTRNKIVEIYNGK